MPSDTVAPSLRIPAGVRERLLREAESAAPREACGALLGVPGAAGTPDRVRAIAPLANVATDPRRAFAVDPAELAPILRGGGVLGFYHSHPGGGTYPSRLDIRGAWRGWWTVIVSPAEASIRAWHAELLDA